MEQRHRDIVSSLLPKPTNVNRSTMKQGGGIINRVIDSLPIPLHLPGYNYAGPGTPLERHLEMGIKPINKLDEAAMHHDIAYANHKDTNTRSMADRVLENKAWDRVKSTDASLGERANAWLVTNAMKLKRLTGQGLKIKTPMEYTPYRVNINDNDHSRLGEAIQNHKYSVTVVVRNHRTKDDVCNETTIPITKNQLRLLRSAAVRGVDVKMKISKRQLEYMKKTGGFLPAIPAILAAAPAIAAVASTLFKTYNDKKTNDRLIEEKIRHNKAIEAKKGSGVYLRKKPIRGNIGGDGVYLKKRKAIGDGIYLNKRRAGKGINVIKNQRTAKEMQGNGLLQQLIKKKSIR